MLPNNKLRKQRINRLLIFPDEHHPYSDNLAKFYEHPELLKISPRDWAKMSAEELKEYHQQLMQRKLNQFLVEIEKS